MSPDPGQPSGGAADEVLQGNWPTASAGDYLREANTHLQIASTASQAAGVAGQGAAQATDDEGQSFSRAADLFGLQSKAFAGHSETHAAVAGWMSHVADAIQTAKTVMAAAVAEHEPIHDLPFDRGDRSGAIRAQKDASMHEAQQKVKAAKAALDQAIFDAVSGIRTGKTPPGGAPSVPDKSPVADSGGLPDNAPQQPTNSPLATSPPPSTSTAPPAGAPPAVTPPATAAGGAPPASSVMGAAPSAGAGSTPASDTSGGGMPMSGAMGGMPSMPMGGMPMSPPMSAPQMPTQTPGNDLAKTIGDTVGKMSGRDGNGMPIDEKTLEKLLDAQGSDSSSSLGGDHAAPAEHETDPLSHKPAEGTHTTLSGPQPPSTAYPGNQPLGGAPSPAAPAVTPPPTIHAPVTELSADDHVSQPPTQHDAHLASPTATAQPQPVLGAYPSGQMQPPLASSGGMPMGMMPMAAAASVGAATATPILAAVVPSTQQPQRQPPPDWVIDKANQPPALLRLDSLPPAHALADRYLGAVVDSFVRNGWAATTVAVGVFTDVRSGDATYVVATSDGLCVLPMNVYIPPGLIALSASERFTAEWAGFRHPAAKLIAYSKTTSDVGRLTYLVSNSAGEWHMQTDADRRFLAAANRSVFTTVSRVAVSPPKVSVQRASDVLHALGAAWGFSDATAADLSAARARLWAARWANTPSADYLAVLATYWYVEGLVAVEQDHLAEAAYSATALVYVPARQSVVSA